MVAGEEKYLYFSEKGFGRGVIHTKWERPRDKENSLEEGGRGRLLTLR